MKSILKSQNNKRFSLVLDLPEGIAVSVARRMFNEDDQYFVDMDRISDSIRVHENSVTLATLKASEFEGDYELKNIMECSINAFLSNEVRISKTLFFKYCPRNIRTKQYGAYDISKSNVKLKLYKSRSDGLYYCRLEQCLFVTSESAYVLKNMAIHGSEQQIRIYNRDETKKSSDTYPTVQCAVNALRIGEVGELVSDIEMKFI